jgi:3-keto-disaccharide hydrolase
MRPSFVVTVTAVALAGAVALSAAPQTAKPPKGFTSLFDGKDLTGWRGRQPNYDPAAEAKLSKEELAAKQAEWNAARDQHWKVDTAKTEIVSDGQSPHLATAKDYGDFEFQVEWLMVSPNGDSGVYLRGYPQVQVWDPDNPREVTNGAPKGSGALWNNNPENPGKWPLVKADNPVGQWNTFKIKMVGSRVWVSLNGKPTVDGQVLDNYFDRAAPIVARGPIELQTHGSEIRFRNIFIREIPAAEAKATLDKIAK